MKGAVALAIAFEIFFGLFKFFLRSLIPKKSSGMQKSCMQGVFPPQPKTKPKFPFRFIVAKKGTAVSNSGFSFLVFIHFPSLLQGEW